MKMNLAYYTCFIGSNNNEAFSVPDLPSHEYDCYFFTNNSSMVDKLRATKWKVVHIDFESTDDVIESNMKSKHIKALPHEYKELQPYDYLVYMDSKLKKVNEGFIEGAIKCLFKENNFAVAMREHWMCQDRPKGQKETVWKEFLLAVNSQERYRLQQTQYSEYITKQCATGLSHLSDCHCVTGFIIRNMKHPKMKQIDYLWYAHILECGIECQISFFFIKQLFKSVVYSFRDNPFLNSY
jgi:hypothetical protein